LPTLVRPETCDAKRRFFDERRPRVLIEVADLGVLLARNTAPAFHKPLTSGPAESADGHTRQNIRDVMIAAIDGCGAHRNVKRQKHPEKPWTVTSRGENRDRGSGDVSGGKRSSVDAAKMLDEGDGCSEKAADERFCLDGGEGEVGALDREKNGDGIDGIVGDGSRDHDGPESETVTRDEEDRRENDEVEKVCHVGELHEVCECGRGKLREPNGWMNAREVEIELDEVAIKPAWENHVHEVFELLEGKDEKRQGIPVAGEAKKGMRRDGGGPGKRADGKEEREMNAEKARGVGNVAMECGDHHIQPEKVDGRDPFESAAGVRELFDGRAAKDSGLLKQRELAVVGDLRKKRRREKTQEAPSMRAETENETPRAAGGELQRTTGQ